MNDFLTVRRADTGGDCRHYFQSSLRRKNFFPRKQVVQRFAFDIFHYEKRHRALCDTVIGNADDVLMTNRRRRQRFLTKARNEFRVVADQIRQDDFYRVLGFQVSVPSFINNAHSALSDAAFKVIFAFQNRLAA